MVQAMRFGFLTVLSTSKRKHGWDMIIISCYNVFMSFKIVCVLCKIRACGIEKLGIKYDMDIISYSEYNHL